MVVDVFTYNGEQDILEIHLNILNDYVDQFIIVEAPYTFTGNPKPLYFEQHKERFSKFLPKIKYYVIDQKEAEKKYGSLADSSPNVPKNGPKHWRNEFIQKEAIKDALTHLQDDDVCFIGDVDEIWNPTMSFSFGGSLWKLKLKVFSYYLNNKSNEVFWGTVRTEYRELKDICLNHIRSNMHLKMDSECGWHFTSIGGIDEVRRKLNDSYTQDSYNTPEVQARLEERFGHADYIGRSGFTFTVDESEWPQYLKDNREKYAHLLR